MKRTLSFLLVLAMLLGCVSIPAMAEEGWITLRVECFDRSVSGLNIEDNMQLDYVQEHFGNPNKIKVEFVPVDRWTETEVLNTLLAGGTAPDICFTYNQALVQQFDGMGGVYHLNDLLEKYGPNLVEFLGEEVLEYGRTIVYDANGNPVLDENGKAEYIQYTLPARRISVAKYGAFVRGDWLEKLGMEEPKTVEELSAYLYAAKEANLGGEQTVPYTVKFVPEAPLFSFVLLVESFLDFNQITAEDWYTKYREQLPGAKEAYRLLNKLYNDGILAETFAIDNGDIRMRNMAQGYSGLFVEGPTQVWGGSDAYQQELEKNVEGGYWIPVNPYKNASLDRYLHENYAANGMCIFIPSWVSEETAAAAIKYLDWMALQENRFFLQQGVEGVNFEGLNEDGLPIGRKGNDELPDEYKMSGDVTIISNGSDFGSEELNSKNQALSFPGYEELVARAFDYVAIDSYAPIGFSVPIQAEADYGMLVLAKQAEFLTAIVTCKPEQFDANYDSYLQAIMDVGGAQIVAERLEAYKNGQFMGEFPAEKFAK